MVISLLCVSKYGTIILFFDTDAFYKSPLLYVLKARGRFILHVSLYILYAVDIDHPQYQHQLIVLMQW